AQIQARVQKIGVRLLGLLEIFNGHVGLTVLKGIYAFIEQVTRLQLAAAGGCKCESRDGGERGNPASSYLKRCMSHEASIPTCARPGHSRYARSNSNAPCERQSNPFPPVFPAQRS